MRRRDSWAKRASRHVAPLAGIRAVPTIDFTDAELAAVTAVIHRTIEDDKFPHAPRLVPMRTAMAKLDDAVMLTGESEAMARAMAPRPTPDLNAPPPAKGEKGARSANAPTPKISSGFKLGRLPPDH